MKASQVVCPRCKAAVGMPCLLRLGSSVIERSTFHRERSNAANKSLAGVPMSAQALAVQPRHAEHRVDVGPTTSDADPGQPSIELQCGHIASRQETLKALSQRDVLLFCEVHQRYEPRVSS